MSIRALKEDIYLVLQIKGGHGFGFAMSPLVITANLAGNIHESFATQPSPQPKFENEFVWVMDKTKMKSIWSDKSPVRVECFTAIQSHRRRIGYIILNVKDAQIFQDESKITENQVRLLGLSKDVSLMKPELILSFYITDIPICSPQLVPQFSPNTEAQETNCPFKVTLGTGKECFTLSIDVDSANNLNMLLPCQSKLELHLMTYTYSLLGAEIHSNTSSNHCVQLDITSSLASLKTYFIHQPEVVVRLKVGSLLVGMTSITMENLLLSEEFNLRKTKHLKTTAHSCVVTPTHNLSESPQDVKPFVNFNIGFKWNTPIVKNKSESAVPTAIHSIGAGGDADNHFIVCPETPVTIPMESSQACAGLNVCSGGETYRALQSISTHTITVTIVRIHLDHATSSQMWLKLSHPIVSVSPSGQIPLSINWTPVQWQLTVNLSSCTTLETTLTTQPALLQLGAGTLVLAAVHLLPPDMLTRQSERTAVLEKGGKQLGELEVSWSPVSTITQSENPPIESLQCRTLQSNTDALSPRARELKILTFVEELEDWAEKQRTIVMEGLKEEGTARLASLQSQWDMEMGDQVTEGRHLVVALKNMRDHLRQQEANLQDNHMKLKGYKEELEQVHRSKLQEFKDLSHRMQDEFNHKLALITSNKVELETEAGKLREENREMKKMLKEFQAKTDSDKKLVNSLTHKLKMLNKKLAMEQESKMFFKDHCRKAEQEIHRLNCLHQQEVEDQLHQEKKTLQQLVFHQIIMEKNDLRQDKRLLNEIRYQLLPTADNFDINTNSNEDMT